MAMDVPLKYNTHGVTYKTTLNRCTFDLYDNFISITLQLTIIEPIKKD